IPAAEIGDEVRPLRAPRVLRLGETPLAKHARREVHVFGETTQRPAILREIEPRVAGVRERELPATERGDRERRSEAVEDRVVLAEAAEVGVDVEEDRGEKARHAVSRARRGRDVVDPLAEKDERALTRDLAPDEPPESVGDRVDADVAQVATEI